MGLSAGRQRGSSSAGWLVALVLLLGAPAAWAQAPSPPNGACFTCHNRIAFEPAAFAASVHADAACSDCHQAFAGDPHGQAEVPAAVPEWLARVLAIEPYASTGAWAACGNCHEDVVGEMEHSRHLAPMLEEGTGDGAFCGDCHGDPHYIQPAPHSPRERFEFISQTCVTCHGDPAVIARHGLNPDVVYTYETSIHGRVARLNPDEAPTCVDCHHAHAVMGADEPDSPLAPERRAAVCGQCHEGANANFASVISHTRLTAEGTPVAYWTTVFFAVLILSVVLLLVLHMLLDILATLRTARGRRS